MSPWGSWRARPQRDDFRSNAFWAQLAFMDEVTPARDDWHRFSQTQHHSLLGPLTDADRPWLKAALADESRPHRRAVALEALIQDWRQRGRGGSELEAVRAEIKGEATLEATLAERTAPPERSEAYEKMEREVPATTMRPSRPRGATPAELEKMA